MEKIIKKSKTKIDLINIKSKFILKKIFESIQKNKVLNIIKYNKKIQNRLNITQNDYKEFLNIEIEIVPFQDYFVTYNFNFSEPKFYHVYFNDNEKELLYFIMPLFFAIFIKKAIEFKIYIIFI